MAHFTLALLFIVSLFNYTDRYMIAILLPNIGQEFHLSDTQLGFLTGVAFTLLYAVLGVPIARLADRFSRKRILLSALAIWSVMTAACGVVHNYVQLVFARVLVGIGEAGSSPPSYSVIANLYPARHRATAMAVYLAGSPGGIVVGFVLGGWVAQSYGWRYALLVTGLCGLVFSVLLKGLFTEPRRGGVDGLPDTPATSLRQGLTRLLANRTFRHAAMGSAFYNALAVAFVNWMPSFFVRSHGLSVKQTGFVLALIFGPVQMVGLLAGGAVSDGLAQLDLRWYLRVPGIVMLLGAPLLMVSLGVHDTTLALACLAVPLLIGGMQVSPIFAITQSLVEVRVPAVASAVLILIINVISGGVGPLAVGMLSDSLVASFGAESLRLALLIVTPAFSLWAAFHYFMGSRNPAAPISGRGYSD